MEKERLLYIKWRETNEIGIPIIDEQHKGIVSVINSLYFFSHMGKGEDVLFPIYIIMEQYSILHFETEQYLLRQFDYPDYDAHVMLHVHLLEELKKLKVKCFTNRAICAVPYFSAKGFWNPSENTNLPML